MAKLPGWETLHALLFSSILSGHTYLGPQTRLVKLPPHVV